MQNTTKAPTDTIFLCHVHMQVRDLFVMFMSAPRYGKLSVGFQLIRIRENSTMNNKVFLLFSERNSDRRYQLIPCIISD
jgi:hypothetical protein